LGFCTGYYRCTGGFCRRTRCRDWNDGHRNNETGWQIRLFPTTVNLAYQTGLGTPDGNILIPQGNEERTGFAHEFVVTGSAGNRRRAAERWARAITFVGETLAHMPEHAPCQHFEIVNGERAVPGTRG
jgi:hypothetical protein